MVFAFFFNDTATTEIYTLSLHDALPIWVVPIVPDESRTFGMEGMFRQFGIFSQVGQLYRPEDADQLMYYRERSEEHTSELQSRQYLVCRLLLEKKKFSNTRADWAAALSR